MLLQEGLMPEEWSPELMHHYSAFAGLDCGAEIAEPPLPPLPPTNTESVKHIKQKSFSELLEQVR